jgi:hypothetical protein
VMASLRSLVKLLKRATKYLSDQPVDDAIEAVSDCDELTKW